MITRLSASHEQIGCDSVSSLLKAKRLISLTFLLCLMFEKTKCIWTNIIYMQLHLLTTESPSYGKVTQSAVARVVGAEGHAS
jgi:hypothetical protein